MKHDPLSQQEGRPKLYGNSVVGFPPTNRWSPRVRWLEIKATRMPLVCKTKYYRPGATISEPLNASAQERMLDDDFMDVGHTLKRKLWAR